MKSPRWLSVVALSAGIVLAAGCSSSHPSASPASTTTTAAGAGGGGAAASSTPTSAGSSGSASGACAVLTTQQIQQATTNSVADGVEDDSRAANGEQHCDWAMTGTNGSGGLAGTLSVNLETGANAAPNFAALRTGPSDIQKKTITGVGDDAELTAGMNLFVKKGNKVIEITYNGVPSSPVEPILVQTGPAGGRPDLIRVGDRSRPWPEVGRQLRTIAGDSARSA